MKDCCYIRVSDFKIPPNELFCQSSLSETIDFTGFIYATKPISFIDQNGTEPELVIIECKRLNRPVSLDLVKVVKATTDDLRFNNELPALVKPFILTTVGFQRGAKLFADYYDINTQIVNHGSNFSFQYINHSFEGISFSSNLSMQISVSVEAPCHCCGERFTKENNENYCQACLEIMRVEDC